MPRDESLDSALVGAYCIYWKGMSDKQKTNWAQYRYVPHAQLVEVEKERDELRRKLFLLTTCYRCGNSIVPEFPVHCEDQSDECRVWEEGIDKTYPDTEYEGASIRELENI